MGTGKSLPVEIIDIWPEIFKSVTLNALPMTYVDVITIHFKDGPSWEIVLDHTKIKNIKQLSDIFVEYKNYIKDVNITINGTKIRHDVEKSIKKLLRKTNYEC